MSFGRSTAPVATLRARFGQVARREHAKCLKVAEVGCCPRTPYPSIRDDSSLFLSTHDPRRPDMILLSAFFPLSVSILPIVAGIYPRLNIHTYVTAIRGPRQAGH